MKAVVVFEWDLTDEVEPEEWQRAAAEARDRVTEGIIEPKPVKGYIAIREDAEAVLHVFEGVQ